MVLSGIQILGFSLGILSWIGMIGTCTSPEWRKNSQGQTLIDSQQRYEGLWVRCTAFATGQTQCEGYNAFFIGLPDVLQVCRGLIISAIVVGFFAIFVSIFGLKCTTIGPRNKVIKARVLFVGGTLFGIAGIAMAGSCYYAFLWTREEGYDAMKGFFIGFGSAGGGTLSSILIIFGSCLPFKRINAHEIRQIPPSRSCPGVFAGAAVSFYARNVVLEYYNPVLAPQLPQQFRFEYGRALFIGWGCLVAGFVCSSLLCGSSAYSISQRQDHAEEDNTVARHTFRPISILHRLNSTNDVIPLHAVHNRLQITPSQRQVFKSKTSKPSGWRTNHKVDDSLPPSSDYNSTQIKQSDQTVHKVRTNEISQISSPNSNSKIDQTTEKDTFVALDDSSHCLGLVQSASGTWKHYL